MYNNNNIIIVLCMRTVTKIIIILLLMHNYRACDPYLHTYQYSVHGHAYMGSSLSRDEPDPLERQHYTMHVCTPIRSNVFKNLFSVEVHLLL